MREIRGELKKVENESSELRTRTQQLTEELDRSRLELSGKTKELEIAKDEMEALKRERAEVGDPTSSQRLLRLASNLAYATTSVPDDASQHER